MFHVMLVLPVLAPMLAVFGIMAAIVLCLPFWVGLGLQAILTAVTEKKGLLILPTMLGWICALGYFFWLRGLVPFWFQLLYWAVFYLCLWLVWWVVSKLRSLVLGWWGSRQAESDT